MFDTITTAVYSWKFSRDLYFKNFVVQTKFVKYKTLKYFTFILSIAKIHENCIFELVNQNKLLKYRALENNQLYGIVLKECMFTVPGWASSSYSSVCNLHRPG